MTLDHDLAVKRQSQRACGYCGQYGVTPGTICQRCGLIVSKLDGSVEWLPESKSPKVRQQPKAKPERKPFRRPEVVEVVWLDSMGYAGWNDRNERIRHLDKIEDMEHVSVGYLIKRTPQYIAVTGSMGYAGQIGDTIQIPMRAVLSVTVLRKTTES